MKNRSRASTKASRFARLAPVAHAPVVPSRVLAPLLFAALSLSAWRAEAAPPRARALHVIAIDSDDAEDQADALSNALRSRVRAAPALSLQESSPSLGVLTAALRCPTHPDAPCLQRIADQIHTDRFIWGLMTRTSGARVVVEVHLWTRGRPDAAVRETYSANLKDANDDPLRAIAERIVEKLTNENIPGTLTVRAGTGAGEVWIGGAKRGVLDEGVLSLDLQPGTYDVEVRVAGYASAHQTVPLGGGQETPVTFRLARPHEVIPEREPTENSEVSARTVLGWGVLGAGAALTIAGAVEGVRFLSLKSDLDDDRSRIGRNVTDVCGVDPSTSPSASDACDTFRSARSARTLGFAFTGLGVAAIVGGVVLLVTEPHAEAPNATSARGDRRLTPVVAPYMTATGGGLDLAGRF